jgi:hypothetical protein
MNCMSQSDRAQSNRAQSNRTGHESGAWFDSEAYAGVRYKITRVSVSRRIELARKIREIGRRLEFLEAGNDAREKIEAAVLAAEIDQAYLEWGLAGVEGLSIDGEEATPASVIEKGPIALAMEILARIKAECGLSENERKN